MSSSQPETFFIVGCGRSGTTLLQQILNHHSRIAIPPETGFFCDVVGHSRRGQLRHLREIERDLEIDLEPPASALAGAAAIDYFEEIARLYLRRLGRPGVTHFGEKSPRHLLVLPRIERLLPTARVLLVYRDGRDVALSLSQVPWSPPDVRVNFAIWLRYCRWHDWAVSRSALPLLPVRYEDLVADPESGIAAVLDFLGLPPEPLLERRTRLAEGIPEWEMPWKARALEPIDASRVGRWRSELEPPLLERLESWGGDTLRRLGYELGTEPQGPPPRAFLAGVYCRWTLWRLGRALRLARRDLLGT